MRHYHNTGKKLVFDKIMIGSHVIDEKKLRRLINKIKNNYELTSAEAEEIVKNYLRKGSLGIGAILNEEVVKGWMYLAKIEPLGDFFGADAVMSEKEAACIIYAHVIARRVLEKTIERIESLE